MKRFGSIAAVLLIFILSALALIKVYDKGKDQKPLRYADIPQETIDWINSIGGGLDDLLSGFNPFPRPTPWDNSGDFGQDPESGLQTLEDEYFIFYFPEKLKKKATLCQQLAHEAIPHLAEVVGKYFYPDDMNGRKVPIYLMPDQRSFDRLMVQSFSGQEGNYDTTAGITIFEISPSGFYLKGIALNGRYAFSEDAYTKNVLWHEMTHYCFFASIDYNQYLDLPKWCYEGIAEYTSLPGERPSFSKGEIKMLREDCDFSAPHFPYVFENYKGGQSIFCHMEDRYKVTGVHSFLNILYRKGIPTSLKENFSTTLPAFEEDWKASLENFID